MSAYHQFRDQFLDRFKDHELTILFKDGPSGIFVVKKPETIIDSFQIMSGPLGLAITGDLGEYSCYQYKSWKWLRGATGDYLAGKMQVESVLNIECVKELLEEDFDDEDLREEILDRLSVLDDGQNVSLNDFEHKELLEDIFEAFGEVPSEYNSFDMGKLSAMTLKFDELLTAQGI